MAATLFWYDIETFGKHPQLDRLAQFAGIRTNGDFEPIGDPIIEYVQIAPDYVPNPQASLITGITPQETLEKGRPEYEVAGRIYQEWMQPGTCVVGYNNIRFDDEFMRNLFYRNLLDPYVREYANRNSRWDLINVMRAAKDLRPDGLEWPLQEDGRPSFRLEELSAANGIAHQHAHDALSDVEATIGLAKLLHDRQPRLFKFLFHNRRKEEVSKLIDLQRRTPLLYTSAMFTRPEGCTTVVAPLAVDPKNRNSVITFDLRFDPRPLLELPVEKLRDRVFTPNEELEGERIPLTPLQINKSPVVAPLKTLDEAAGRRLGLDLELIQERQRLLQSAPNLTEKVRAVFDHEGGLPEAPDVDMAIYTGGFFMDEDKALFSQLHEQGIENWRNFSSQFIDQRAEKLLHRMIGRNYPSLFSDRERLKWKNFCATRLLFPPGNKIDDFGTYEKKLDTLIRSTELGPREKLIIRSLVNYGNHLKETVLAYK
ncbi:MAG: exodeoxyribonuclease I [Spirochaetia bacterium]